LPELPDVETFRRYFDATSLHQEIEGVKVEAPRILSGVTAPDLEKALVGDQFKSSQRVGKYLFAGLEKGLWIVFHFGMTGSFQYFKDPGDEPEHTVVLISFTKGYHLSFIDIRKFGLISLTESIDAFTSQKELGPDALSITEEEFHKLLEGRWGSVKSTLMNQSVLSGIGNIYSDEILFQAAIHPERNVDTLDEKTIHRLFTTIQEVLETAIDAGADIEKLPKSFIIPHRKKGGICPHCGEPLVSTPVNGRTAYYCPELQHR
jgi:formamidopyrimidine-DNA glycosylase